MLTYILFILDILELMWKIFNISLGLINLSHLIIYLYKNITYNIMTMNNETIKLSDYPNIPSVPAQIDLTPELVRSMHKQRNSRLVQPIDNKLSFQQFLYIANEESKKGNHKLYLDHEMVSDELIDMIFDTAGYLIKPVVKNAKNKCVNIFSSKKKKEPVKQYKVRMSYPNNEDIV